MSKLKINLKKTTSSHFSWLNYDITATLRGADCYRIALSCLTVDRHEIMKTLKAVCKRFSLECLYVGWKVWVNCMALWNPLHPWRSSLSHKLSCICNHLTCTSLKDKDYLAISLDAQYTINRKAMLHFEWPLSHVRRSIINITKHIQLNSWIFDVCFLIL